MFSVGREIRVTSVHAIPGLNLEVRTGLQDARPNGEWSIQVDSSRVLILIPAWRTDVIGVFSSRAVTCDAVFATSLAPSTAVIQHSDQ